MRPASKKTAEAITEIMNRHVAYKTPTGELLSAGDEAAALAVDLVNEIMGATAEGSRLVIATDTSGQLLGFVSSSAVNLPTPPAEEPVDTAGSAQEPSPEEGADWAVEKNT